MGQKDNIEIISLDDNDFLKNIELCTEGEDVVEVISVDNKREDDIVPSYKSDFKGPLTTKEFSMVTGELVNDAAPILKCFNCLGQHNISSCPHPRDARKITMNKKKILGSRPSGPQSKRYHLETENKYNFQAGVYSDRLRKALGLQDNEAPEFIYRMRVMGYPPGWLKEAEVERAALSVFHGPNSTLEHPEDEEGEVDVNTLKYEPEKLVEFPGFNVPLPKHIKDQSRDFGFPSMQSCHQKRKFEHVMKQNKATKYKRKNLSDSDTTLNTKEKVAYPSQEMDMDDSVSPSKIEFNPPLPLEKQPSPPPYPAEVEDGEISDSASQSPTVDSNSASATQSPQEDISQSSIEGQSSSEKPTKRKSLSKDSLESSQLMQPSLSHLVKRVKHHHRSQSKGFDLGTHIPPSITPFNTLPDSDKWAVNVTDHINFENLPHALGTWEVMKSVVGKVKNKMSSIHAEDE